MKYRNIINALLLSCICAAANAQESSWTGELDIQGTKLPLVFNFTSNGCTIDSPKQGAKGIPAEKSVTGDGSIKVDIQMIGATFEGKMGIGSISGTFMQNGIKLPLTLTPGKPEVKRPQTPAAPFSYKEENISFTNDGYSFNGTLTMPEGCTGKTPVVLMVTGSGPQNRDEEVFDHKPFAVIADALARNGIASLRYDDRGWGDGQVNFFDFTTNDFKRDADAALKLLRQRFGKVGILGHSEGGTIALMLAAEEKPDFVVSLAGMAVSGKETLIAQNRMALTSVPVFADKADSFCKVLDKIFGQLAAGKKTSEIDVDGVPDLLKPMLEAALNQCDNNYMRYFITLDPSKSLDKIKCPVLALNGTKDMQVDCSANLGALEKGLVGCSHTVKPVEGLNHLFQHCQTGCVEEYQQIEETISPDVLKVITDWVNGLK